MQIRIERLSYGGRGVGKHNGKTVFVGNTVPGDVVEVRVTKDKKSYSEAEIEKITEPSPYRVRPVCEYFEKCGGCQWQNVDYQTQLHQKENILGDSIKRIGGFTDVDIEGIEPSDKQYGYRNRVVLNLWQQEGKIKVGYNEEKSSQKVSIAHCPVADENINRAIERINNLFENYELMNTGPGKITMAGGVKDSVVAVDTGKISLLLNNLIEISEKGEIKFRMLETDFVSSAGVFNQANYYINEKISEYILSFTRSACPQKVLDLYCGFGNFSIPLAKYSKQVLAVDSDKKAVNFARRNAEHNKTLNLMFKNDRVEKFLKTLSANEFDFVLLDPPRTGAREATKIITMLKPAFIVYVSCNPSTLARDLKVLSSGGYRVESVKPFDMFPQTYHIESVAILSYDTT